MSKRLIYNGKRCSLGSVYFVFTAIYTKQKGVNTTKLSVATTFDDGDISRQTGS